MTNNLIEIQACISSVSKMLEKAKKFVIEYDEKVRKVPVGLSPKIETLNYVISFTELRNLDLLCTDTIKRCLPNHTELVERWYIHDNVGSHGPEDAVKDLQVKLIILQQALAILEAYETTPLGSKERPIPFGYSKLSEPVQLFLNDSKNECHEYDKNVFIMTRFSPGNKALQQIDITTRRALKNFGFNGHRADDRCYPNDRNLWDNVCTYMVCCKFGIAILENIIQDEFNPNVALEYGFMRALGKPTLLLKEKRFNARADILGTLWEEFDILDIENTISPAIQKWCNDIT